MTGGTDTLFTSLDSGVDMILQGDSMANMMVMAMDKDTGVFSADSRWGARYGCNEAERYDIGYVLGSSLEQSA